MAIEIIPITTRESWLAARKQDVTASDIAALFGLHPYKTKFQLWCEKAGIAPPAKETRLMERGRHLEDAVLNACQENHPDWKITKPGNYYRDTEWRIGATPDAVASTPDGDVLIQCKVIESKVIEAWGDEPPMVYQLQVNTEAMLTGHRRAILAVYVLSPFNYGYREYVIDILPEVHQRFTEAVPAFWQSIAEGRQPEPDFEADADLIAARYRPSEGEKEIDLTGDNRIPELLAEWIAAKALEKGTGARLSALKAEITMKLDGATTAILPGYVITNRLQHRAAYEVKATSFPVLKIKSTKEF